MCYGVSGGCVDGVSGGCVDSVSGGCVMVWVEGVLWCEWRVC